VGAILGAHAGAVVGAAAAVAEVAVAEVVVVEVAGKSNFLQYFLES